MDLILVDKHWASTEISGVLLGADRGSSLVMICASEFIKGTRLRQVLFDLLLLCLVFVDGHHILQIVPLRAKFWSLSDSSHICLHEYFLIDGLVSFSRLVLKTSRDLAFETFRCIMRVALSEKVLRIDTRDEARVAWDALVANLMSWSDHPGAGRLAHISTHRNFLRCLICPVN